MEPRIEHGAGRDARGRATQGVADTGKVYDARTPTAALQNFHARCRLRLRHAAAERPATAADWRSLVETAIPRSPDLRQPTAAVAT